MRPDQHKQKASAKYKKKHGMQGGQKGTGRGSDKDASKVVADPKKVPLQPQGLKVVGDKRNDSPAQDVSDAEQERRRYKREITSNWAKYEMEPVSDEDEAEKTMRGGDFSQLINVTSDAMSQFRLKDELEWDNETGQDDAELPKYLTLDLADLVSTVKCVPLDTRLSIEPELFKAHQLEAFREAAARHEELYIAAKNAPEEDNDDDMDTDQKVDTSETCVKSHDDGEDILDELLNDDIITAHESSKEPDSKEVVTVGVKNTQDKCHHDDGPGQMKQQPSSDRQEQMPSQKALEEDDLDMLLALDTPVTTIPDATSVDKKPVVNDKMERKVPQDHTNVAVPATKVSNTEGFNPVDCDDDEWLDSLLDE